MSQGLSCLPWVLVLRRFRLLLYLSSFVPVCVDLELILLSYITLSASLADQGEASCSLTAMCQVEDAIITELYWALYLASSFLSEAQPEWIEARKKMGEQGQGNS